jgi:hypothetical protein
MVASYQASDSMLGAAFLVESEVAFLREVVGNHHLAGPAACKGDTHSEEELPAHNFDIKNMPGSPVDQVSLTVTVIHPGSVPYTVFKDSNL